MALYAIGDLHLSLGTDIPEFHPERRGYRKGYAQQDGNVLEQLPYLSCGAERAFEHRFEEGNRGCVIDKNSRNKSADDKSDKNCRNADEKRLAEGY